MSHSGDWKGRKIDLLIIFPLEMSLVRNLTRPECEASITRLYGNRKWQTAKKELLEGQIRLDNQVLMSAEGGPYSDLFFLDRPFFHRWYQYNNSFIGQR